MSNQYPRVSIIVTIYNVGAFLEQCLQSIAAQTVTDLQIILVDDGSTDGSGEVCDRFAREDSRIRVLHQSNGGVSVARNAGLQAAAGKWIMFVDGDDWLEPNGVESLLAAVGEDPDCDVVAGTHYWNRPDWELLLGEEVPLGTRYEYDLQNDRTRIITDILAVERVPQLAQMDCSLTAPWGKLYRRSFLEAHQLRFLPQLRRSEDWVFNLYVQQHARKLLAIHAPLYHYRVWEGSVSEQSRKNKIPMERFFTWVQEVDRFLKTYGYDGALRDFFIYGRAKEVAMIWTDQYKEQLATWPEATAGIREMEQRGYFVPLANPYYSWKDRLFAVLLKFRLYRLFWMVRCVRNT